MIAASDEPNGRLPDSRDFREIKNKGQTLLVQFLQADLALAGTFCDLAETTSSSERRDYLIGNVLKALDTVRQLGCRVEDSSVLSGVMKRADELEQRCVFRR